VYIHSTPAPAEQKCKEGTKDRREKKSGHDMNKQPKFEERKGVKKEHTLDRAWLPPLLVG
jgi:hypothetical protein